MPIERLIDFRKREAKERRGSDYRKLRHNYLDAIERHVERIAKVAPHSRDRSELDRAFQSDMEDDLRDLPANPIVDRTIAQLRKAKPSSINGLVTVEGLNIIKVSVAPASIDRHPTGLLAFELEKSYLLGSSPRRSFKDAKVQRIENMASDIAVGIAVLAAAKKDDRVKREEQARQREEEKRLRELALRREHIAERRGKALDEVLEEIASLDRLRRLVANLRSEELSVSTGRVAEFLGLAERQLASREAAISTDGLEQRFEKNKLFGDDDDHAFRPPYGYY